MLNGPRADAEFKEYGISVLRISLGVMYLAHSVVLKYFTFTLAGSAQYFVSIGLPAWLSYATFFAEAIGGVMLVLGIQGRWVALVLSPILLGALFSAHLANGWVFTAPGGGWEYPAYLFVLSIAQFLLGDGALALKPSRPLSSLIGRTRSGLAFG
jgi:putative oxidoreductase